MQMKVQRHFPQAEVESSDGRMFFGNWEHVESETHNHRLGNKVAGDGYLGLDESMDITTVNEQGVQLGFHKRGDEESSVQEDSCGKTILAHGSASVCQLEVEIERELESHDRERKMTSCTEPEYTCSLFVACTSCSTMRVGISCMNTVRASCRGGKIASKKFRR